MKLSREYQETLLNAGELDLINTWSTDHDSVNTKYFNGNYLMTKDDYIILDPLILGDGYLLQIDLISFDDSPNHSFFQEMSQQVYPMACIWMADPVTGDAVVQTS